MDDLIKALAAIEGVLGVGLGGSRGFGAADPDSDYDFVLFRDGGELITAESIQAAIQPFADPGSMQASGDFVRAETQGTKIEVFQKDLAIIRREIEMAEAGKFRWTTNPLFPHGDLSTRLISHLIFTEICFEKKSAVTALQAKATPLPLALKNSLVRHFIRQASYSLKHAEKVRKKEDLQNLVALVSGFIYFTNIVIFSLNNMYPILEKGAARIIPTLSCCPPEYESLSHRLFDAAIKGDLAGLKQLMTSHLKTLAGHANLVLA